MKKWILAAIIVLVALVGLVVWDKNRPGELDAFAQCLTDKGVTYYGAFWCPNCQKQNEIFGRSKRYIPYVECSTPDGKSQVEQCRNANITAYPTWEFEGGERLTGVQPLETLAEKTGCELRVN